MANQVNRRLPQEEEKKFELPPHPEREETISKIAVDAMFDPDVLDPDYVTVGESVLEKSPDGTVVVKVSQEGLEILHRKVFGRLPPNEQYSFARQTSLPDHITANALLKTTKNIAESAKHEANRRFEEYGADEKKCDDAEEIQGVSLKMEKEHQGIRKRVNRSKKRWDSLMQDLTEQFKKELSETWLDDLFKIFFKLREIHPDNFAPFEPMIRFAIYLLNPSDQENLLKDAKRVDPQKTYRCTLFSVNLVQTFFPKWKQENLNILKLLQRLYPHDLVIPTLIKSIQTNRNGSVINLTDVSDKLSQSLNQLMRGDFKNSLLNLGIAKQQLFGFAEIYAYFFLVRIVKGELGKARKLLTCVKDLPNFTPTESLTPLLNCYFEMVRDEGRPKNEKARAFFDTSIETLNKGPQPLPFVYMGVKWLAENCRFIPKDFPKHNELEHSINSLIELLLLQITDADEWVELMFKEKNSHDFTVNPEGGAFQHKRPNFDFHYFALTESSANSVRRETVLHLLDLKAGIQFSKMNLDRVPLVNDEAKTFLPSSSVVFRMILQEGLPRFRPAAEELFRQYNAQDPKPYPLSPLFKEWAQFCMERVVKAPSRGALKQLTPFLESHIKIKPDRQTVSAAYFDVSNAIKRIVDRSDQIDTYHILPSDKGSLFRLMDVGKDAFGWKFDQTFEAWGDMLQEASKEGPMSPDFRLTESRFIGFEKPEANGIGFGIKGRSVHVFPHMRLYLQFWLNFHRAVTSHNQSIQGGADDKGTKQKQWEKGVDINLWKDICKNNTPNKYRGYNSLGKKKKEQLTKIVKNKYDHTEAFKTLKEKYNTLTANIEDEDEKIRLMTTTLVVAAEYKREDASFSIYVPTEQMARKVYQILLEVGYQRIVADFIARAGPQKCSLKKEMKPMQVLLEKLKVLGKTFHGPEVHLSGNGPIEKHYNGQVIDSKLKPINTHIYFS